MTPEGKDFRLAIARRLVALRREAGITQRECADALGVNQPAYAKMESADTPLRRRDRVTLAVLYGLGEVEAFPMCGAAESVAS